MQNLGSRRVLAHVFPAGFTLTNENQGKAAVVDGLGCVYCPVAAIVRREEMQDSFISSDPSFENLSNSELHCLECTPMNFIALVYFRPISHLVDTFLGTSVSMYRHDSNVDLLQYFPERTWNFTSTKGTYFYARRHFVVILTGYNYSWNATKTWTRLVNQSIPKDKNLICGWCRGSCYRSSTPKLYEQAFPIGPKTIQDTRYLPASRPTAHQRGCGVAVGIRRNT